MDFDQVNLPFPSSIAILFRQTEFNQYHTWKCGINFFLQNNQVDDTKSKVSTSGP
jgi:hypothetical protein